MTKDTYETLGGGIEVADVAGRLRVHRPSETGELGSLHTTEFVRSRAYTGMADNDIRGFLDGTFLYGWNQATQKYVRAGRIDDVWGYGEYELFRILHRWDDLQLPSDAVVQDVQLELHLSPRRPECTLRFFLYPVLADWGPGFGGVGEDNTSPPLDGEVWWNDRTFGRESWGLPGASSREDRGGAPIAACVLPAGVDRAVFQSEALTTYVQEAHREGRPVLFLIKLQDDQEDIPGSVTHVWSSSEGEDRNRGRKPTLTVFWRAPDVAVWERELLLEHGTSLILPLRGGTYMEFIPSEGSDSVEMATRDAGGEWSPVDKGAAGEGHLELRVRAVKDPVVFGRPFQASFRDTWVRTAAPEDQNVPWFFTSPTGREVVVRARFDGDFTWKVEFTPDEVGRWSFWWRHDFQIHRYLSRPEVFDVLIDAQSQAVPALKHFLGLVLAGGLDTREKLSRMMVRFSKLERQVMALLSPTDYRSETGMELIGLMRQIREELGSPVPDPIPLQPADPHPWEDSQHRPGEDGQDRSQGE